jgi:hypothetical protein
MGRTWNRPGTASGTHGDASAITPHDTNPNEFSRLYIGSAGNITLVTRDGNTVLFSNLPAGFILPVQTSIIKSTGTTATNIVGLK